MDWGKAARDIIGTVAPTVATALGGPLAGVATRVLAGVLLGNEDAPQKAVEDAVLKSSPADLAKVRVAEMEFAAKMKELDVDLERLHQADRDSARKRDIALGGDLLVKLLAMAIIGGFFATIFYVLTGRALVDTAIAGALVGYVSAKAEQVVSYYFGSSAGSKQKTDAMSTIMKGRA